MNRRHREFVFRRLVDSESGPTCSKAVKDAVLAQDWVAVGADQHTGLCVPEDVVLLQQT